MTLKNIRLDVAAGEVIGIAGVAGNGQGELFEAVSGEALQRSADTIRIRGKTAGRLSIPAGACLARPSFRRSGLAMVRRRA